MSDDADFEIYDLLRDDDELWPDRTIRSGGYWVNVNTLRAQTRDWDQPNSSGEGFGMRVVCGMRKK